MTMYQSFGRKMLLVVAVLGCAKQSECTIVIETESCLESQEDEAALFQTEAYMMMNEIGSDKKRQMHHTADGPVVLNSTTASPHSTTTTANGDSVVGVSLNSPSDIYVFLQTLCLHSCLVTCAIFFVSIVLRQRYPMMYRYKELTNQTSVKCDDSYFGWINTVWREVNLDKVQEAAGLDGCMIVAFTQLSMKIMVFIGVPLIFIDAPLQAFLGGDAAGDDILSYAGMGNLLTGKYPAIYYIESIFTIYIVFAIMSCIYTAQRDLFIPRREKWLRSMAKPRSATVLVEGIPDEWRSDQALQTYFEKLFGKDNVKEAFVIKYTSTLCSYIVEMKQEQDNLEQATFKWKKDGETEEARPKFNFAKTPEGSEEAIYDCMTYYEKQIKVYEEKIEKERKHIKKCSELPPEAYDRDTGKITDAFWEGFTPGQEGSKWYEWSDVYAANGFVEFTERREAEIAEHLHFKPDDEEMVTSLAPSPDDIIYTDFQHSKIYMSTTMKFWTSIGYGCVLGLFIGFMPIVTSISTVTNLDTLAQSSSFVKGIVQAMGPLKSMIQGVLASAGLTIFMDFLPTFLMIIFYRCWQLKAQAWAQHKLQIYYFWFQVIFIVLVSAVGGSIVTTITKIVSKPTMLFTLLAAALPNATHFYMNFLMLQWFTHALNLTRYMYITKFLIFKGMYDLEDAKKKAEPEDQDYYGYGGRSARFGINLVIGIVFSQLCPFITLLCFICFVLCRTFYGYLYTFAENKKPDMGGVFWVTQLEQVQKCVVIFIVLMNGVFLQRAPTYGVFFVSCLAWPIWFFFWHRFQHHLQWESIPFETLHQDKDAKQETKRPPPRTTFKQPELVEKLETIKASKWPM